MNENIIEVTFQLNLTDSEKAEFETAWKNFEEGRISIQDWKVAMAKAILSDQTTE